GGGGESVAHECSWDDGRDRRAEAFAVGERGLRAVDHLPATEILARGDVDHLLGNDAGPGELVLRDRLAVERAPRLRRVGKIAGEMFARDIAVVDRLDRTAFIFLDAAALFHPFDACALEALFDVDGDAVVGV